jgi:hypothetical protein
MREQGTTLANAGNASEQTEEEQTPQVVRI